MEINYWKVILEGNEWKKMLLEMYWWKGTKRNSGKETLEGNHWKKLLEGYYWVYWKDTTGKVLLQRCTCGLKTLEGTLENWKVTLKVNYWKGTIGKELLENGIWKCILLERYYLKGITGLNLQRIFVCIRETSCASKWMSFQMNYNNKKTLNWILPFADHFNSYIINKCDFIVKRTDFSLEMFLL